MVSLLNIFLKVQCLSLMASGVTVVDTSLETSTGPSANIGTISLIVSTGGALKDGSFSESRRFVVMSVLGIADVRASGIGPATGSPTVDNCSKE
jgi:hypothetical protein